MCDVSTFSDGQGSLALACLEEKRASDHLRTRLCVIYRVAGKFFVSFILRIGHFFCGLREQIFAVRDD